MYVIDVLKKIDGSWLVCIHCVLAYSLLRDMWSKYSKVKVCTLCVWCFEMLKDEACCLSALSVGVFAY